MRRKYLSNAINHQSNLTGRHVARDSVLDAIISLARSRTEEYRADSSIGVAHRAAYPSSANRLGQILQTADDAAT